MPIFNREIVFNTDKTTGKYQTLENANTNNSNMKQLLSIKIIILWLCLLIYVDCTQKIKIVADSENLYSLLKNSKSFTLVYIYSSTCHWCQQLDPKFDYLSSLFLDNSNVSFTKINKRQARIFIEHFQISSFPQLLLFKPSLRNDEQQIDSLFVAVYRSYRTVASMAVWLTEMTGQFPKWPNSKVKSEIMHLSDLSKGVSLRLRKTLGFPLVEGREEELLDDQTTTPIILTFITPWIDSHYLELFNGDASTSVLERLAEEFSDFIFYRIDGSLKSMSLLTNEFRCSITPTIIILMNNNIIKIEFSAYNKDTWGKEYEIIRDILEICSNNDKCSKFVEKLSAIYIYRSISELQNSLEQYDYIDYDIVQDVFLFNKLRDI